MNLLINVTTLLGQQTGIGNYTKKIAEGIEKNKNILTPTYFYGYRYSNNIIYPKKNEADNLFRKMKNRAINQPAIRYICKKFFSYGNIIYSCLKKKSYDCYFEPNYILNPWIRSKYSVVTVHDLSCFKYPQWHPYERVRFMERNFAQSLRRADKIITVSNAIREEVINMFGIEQEQLVTIENGVDREFFHPQSLEYCQSARKRLKLPEHFILSVGTIEPRKNLLGLLKAYSSLPFELQQHYPLLIIGGIGWKNIDIIKNIELNSKHVHFLGYVTDIDLLDLYCTADVFTYPSWYEGFGLPVLEALACGCPVLISKDPALCEICDDAALQAPADDIDVMSEKLQELLEDNKLRNTLKEKGLRRASIYSWEKSINRHIELFTKLLY